MRYIQQTAADARVRKISQAQRGVEIAPAVRQAMHGMEWRGRSGPLETSAHGMAV